MFESQILSADALRARGQGLHRLPEPWSLISERWGAPSLVNLYGAPGSGKSTLATKLADVWPGRSIYLSLEEGLGSTLAQRAARLEIRRVDFAYPSTWQELVEQVRPYSLVVVDSLQMLKASAAPGTIRAELVDRAAKCVLVTSQVNAQGDVAGGKSMGHFADVVVRLPAYGQLVVEKNRYGPVKGEASWLEG
jgi:predicted ATP-dependent serine protease